MIGILLARIMSMGFASCISPILMFLDFLFGKLLSIALWGDENFVIQKNFSSHAQDLLF